jgi:tetratricopeptide (TPR) repeat protein
VTDKYPGYVDAQLKLATLVRAQGNRSELAEVLFRLALARRAAGDTDGAREAARDAGEQSPLPQDQQELLRRMGLLPAAPEPQAEAVESPSAPERAPTASGHPVAESSDETASAESTQEDSDEAEDVEIVFGAEPAAEPGDAGDAPAAPAPREVRVPPSDVVEEIRFYREQGMGDEARSKVAALRTLGYGGPELDALEAELGTAKAASSAPVEASATSVRLDDGDLTDLTAALAVELTDGEEATGAAGEGEESLEEVFAAFKRQVEDEVGSEDFRTHYDLGIAYKEMGLLNDALKEFEVASGSPELFREACSMAALCQRQRGDIEGAVRWYQKALEAPGGTPEELQGLQYDLADALLQQGNDQAALDMFQSIMDGDPGYRDVQSRVTDLQSRHEP